jgi:hypothetical protein
VYCFKLRRRDKEDGLFLPEVEVWEKGKEKLERKGES